MKILDNTPCDDCDHKAKCPAGNERGNDVCLKLWEDDSMPFTLSKLFDEQKTFEQTINDEGFKKQMVAMNNDLQLEDKMLNTLATYIAQTFVQGMKIGISWYEDKCNQAADRLLAQDNSTEQEENERSDTGNDGQETDQ